MSGLGRLEGAFGGVEHVEVAAADGMPCVEVERDDLIALMTLLRDELGFEACTIVTAVDHFPREPRFQVVHQLLSLRHNDRVRVHCRVSEDDARVPSVTGLWPGAAYFEREAYDMFGLRFDGHADLKRLLMPEGYGHHPLRKDFPHQGIEPDRLYKEWDRARRHAAGSQG